MADQTTDKPATKTKYSQADQQQDTTCTVCRRPIYNSNPCGYCGHPIGK